ncbi:ATP-binding protein [Candidatus Parcubacteria bacterium]|nr:ATP-binding protein [Candidatus Parcubacteria bacterium]
MITNEKIIEILNEWNFWQKKQDIGIIRSLYLNQLKKYLATDEIVTISGIRRSGKSIIMLQLIDYLINSRKINPRQTLYVNFEDPKFFPFLNLDFLDKILEAYQEIVSSSNKKIFLFLDEVQKIKGWEHWVRACYDKKVNIKIFVTGSSADLMSSEFSSLLTGRHLELTVFPLCFKEYIEFNSVIISPKHSRLEIINNKNILIKLAKQFIKQGGFPKIVITKQDNLKKELLIQYFNDIVAKDIGERHKLKNVAQLKALALFYANNFSNLISYNKIKKLLGIEISLDSIERFSNYLVESYLFYLVPKFSYSLAGQIKSNKKVYIADNGIRDAVSFKFSDDYGKYLENIVFLELKKEKMEIYYWHEGKEADFLVKQKNKVRQVINVCYDLSDELTRKREIDGLLAAMTAFKLKQGLIITEKEDVKVKFGQQTIIIKPFWKWSLGL